MPPQVLLENALVFAKTLQTSLAATDSISTSSIIKLHEINNLLAHANATPRKATKAASESGIELWNLSTKLGRKDGSPLHLVALVKAFAYLLLDHGVHVVIALRTLAKEGPHPRNRENEIQAIVQAHKCAIKAAESCIDHGHVALAEALASKIAVYQESCTEQYSALIEDSENLLHYLGGEYVLLRAKLSYKQNRLDLVRNWLKKLDPDLSRQDSVLQSKLVQFWLTVATDQHQMCGKDASMPWLMEAHATLNKKEQTNEKLLADTTRELVRCVMSDPSQEAKIQARKILESTKFSKKVTSALLGLEVFDFQSARDRAEYGNILQAAIESMGLAEHEFSVFLYIIRRLKSLAPTLAAESLQHMLCARLLKIDAVPLVENALVMWIGMPINGSCSSDFLPMLWKLLDEMTERTIKLGELASQACQTLLWKFAEQLEREGKKDEASECLYTGLHTSFCRFGGAMMEKLYRKYLSNALEAGDLAKASQIAAEVDPSTLSDIRSLFLLCKLELLVDEHTFVPPCLFKTNVALNSEDCKKLLCACVIFLRETGKTDQTLGALESLSDWCQGDPSPTVDFPTLTRCIIAMLLKKLQGEQEARPDTTLESDIAWRIRRKFSTAASLARDGYLTTREKVWFAESSYNFLYEYKRDLGPPHEAGIADKCVQLLESITSDADAATEYQLKIRMLCCQFLVCSSRIRAAHETKDQNWREKCYREVEKQAAGFLQGFLKIQLTLDVTDREMLVKKAQVLVTWELDAALHFKAWAAAQMCISRCTELCSSTGPNVSGDLPSAEDGALARCADVVLRAEIPSSIRVSLLQQIIDRFTQTSKPNFPRIARWYRCLFRLSHETNPSIAEHLLDQALQQSSDPSHDYPRNELEYLATLAFNRAERFYEASQTEQGQHWADKAMQLAARVAFGNGGDGGRLLELLKQQYASLQ